MGEDNLVFAGQRVEFVGRGDEFFASRCRDLGSDGGSEVGQSVQAGSDSGAAESQFAQTAFGPKEHFAVFFQHRVPAAHLLTKGQGRRVLQVCAAGLDDAAVVLRKVFQCRGKRVQAWQHGLFDGGQSGNVHRRRERVVATLRLVDVIIGMDDLLAEDLVGAIGDDFVDIHVTLGAATSLPDDEREVVVKLAGKDVVAGGNDAACALFVKVAKLAVGQCGSLFQDGKSANDLDRHLLDAYLEVFKAALGLGAPVFVGWDLDLAHRVVFDTVFHLQHVLICCIWRGR